MKAQNLATVFTIFILSSRIWVSAEDFNVGVVLDLQTIDGKMSKASISLAMEDIDRDRVLHNNRLILHYKDSNEDEVEAASAALDLMEDEKVKAIIGPWTSSQAAFMIELGNERQVPIISFSATSPSLSSPRYPYFIRTTTSDAAQAGCIAAIVKLYGWPELVPIYDNTPYGTGIMPHLLDVLQAVHVRLPSRKVIPPSASKEQISAMLEELKNSTTRVFLVHMSKDLRVSLFTLAQDHGMMKEGFVWIVTESVEDIQQTPNLSMQSVIGCMPRVPLPPPNMTNFTDRWKRKFSELNREKATPNPNIYSLRAYDTVRALALSVNKTFSTNATSIVKAVEETSFQGIAGNFKLQDKQLEPSPFDIVNVVGNNSTIVAVWSQMNGISLSPGSEKVSSPEDLRVIWPGNLSTVPKGWEMPFNGNKLRVGVPRKGGFKEFVEYIESNNSYKGFCIDVFDEVMKSMNYKDKYDFHLFNKSDENNSDWTYNEFVEQVFNKNYDIIVGDVTILANRSKLVDFSLPFIESGWTMLVTVKERRPAESWIFMKVWSMDLWFTTLAFFMFTGFAVWIIEHRVNPAFRGPPSEQIGTTLYFAFSTSVYKYSESLVSNLSRLLMIVWVFVVLILNSSFTANLSSLMTVNNLEPIYTDISELLQNNHSIGYQEGSFIKDHLIKLGFDSNRMKTYKNVDEYKDALSKGPEDGGVAAIFDELPYLQLFLAKDKHNQSFMISGPVHKANGFGFVFPKGSPLLDDVSREVLKLIEGPQIEEIENKWFHDDRSTTLQKSEPSFLRLPFRSFQGLFCITGSVSAISLFLFVASFFLKNRGRVRPVDGDASSSRMGSRVIAWIKHYDSMDSSNSHRKDASQESTQEDGDLDSITPEESTQNKK